MGIKMRDPIVIHENKECLSLSQEFQDQLRAQPAAVLWHRRGLYGLIPEAVIQNELRIREDRKRLFDAEDNQKTTYWDIPLVFKWMETKDVPNGARIVTLLEKQSDNSGTGCSDQNDG